MAGLLDFLNTPEAQLGIGLLAYSGDMGRPMGFGERIAGALGSTQKQQLAAEEKKLRAGLLEAQTDEIKSKAAQRAQVQGLMGGLFGVPSTSMGGGSNVAPEAAPVQGGGAQGLRGLPIERIAALKAAGGPDLIEAWKQVNVPTSMAAGSYAMIPGQQPQYMADPSKGMGIGPQGVYMLPGADTAAAKLAGAAEEAKQRAQANWRESTVIDTTPGPTYGQKVVQPSARTLGAQPGYGTEPKMRATANQPQGGTAGQYDRDIADIRKALADPRLDAGSRQLLTQALADRTEQRGRYFGGAPAGAAGGGSPGMAGNVVELSPEQQAQNDAIKAGMVARATDTAKADVVRDTDTQKKAKSANAMIAAADRALELLQNGPTASGFGEILDKGAAFLGRSTPGAQVAAQLDIVAGDLVNNVPRMEGPQSDGDRLEYRTQAGRAADRNLPVAQRTAAMHEVKRLQSKYAPLNGGESPPSEQPKPTTFEDMPSAVQYKGRRIRGDDGRILQSDGMSWKEVR